MMKSNLRPPKKPLAVQLLVAAIIFFSGLLLFLSFSQDNLQAQDGLPADDRRILVRQRFLADQHPPESRAPQAATPCVDGFAGDYPCDHVDLMAFVPLSSFNANSGNDVWGWTDASNGKEYALMGLNNGVAFVDVSDAESPEYLGKLPTHTGSSSWRDVKVYQNHAFVVSDGNGSHGMQVFDLTRLRSVANPPVTFTEDGHYNGVGSAHNVVINEATGFAFIVGAGSGTQSGCSGGLHMVDISTPTSPDFAGCFSADQYTHDAQCLIYNGLDEDYTGHEICFNANEDTVTIVDVTDKENPVQISRTSYTGSRYTHQLWVADDQSLLFVNDEYDEVLLGHNTRTYIWDLSNLDSPVNFANYTSTTVSIDHNHYLKDDLLFQANYRAGLRILDISGAASGSVTEKGFFDIYPSNDNPSYNGAWSNYPYFASGNILVSGIEQGLFILKPNGITTGLSEQEIVLDQGWNFLSSYIDPQNTEISSILAPLGNELILLKNGDGEIFWPEFEIDQIGNWEKLEGYSIFMMSEQTLTIAGQKIDPALVSAELIKGWNLVGFWRDSAVNVTTAVGPIESQFVLAKNEVGQVYWPEYNINGFTQLIPGEGYMFFLNSPATLQYPE